MADVQIRGFLMIKKILFILEYSSSTNMKDKSHDNIKGPTRNVAVCIVSLNLVGLLFDFIGKSHVKSVIQLHRYISCLVKSFSYEACH